jgi:hypothetical protein
MRSGTHCNKRGTCPHPVNCVRYLSQAAAATQDFHCHRLHIAVELRDDPVAALLLFMLALLFELGEVLGSPLGCCRSH